MLDKDLDCIHQNDNDKQLDGNMGTVKFNIKNYIYLLIKLYLNPKKYNNLI